MHVFYRLCYVKLKLLLIAIEYKSEQRESRFVFRIFLSITAVLIMNLLCDSLRVDLLIKYLVMFFS